MNATVTKQGVLSMQVCVPKGWTPDQIEAFANKENPSGTALGWKMRQDGDEALNGAKARVQCAAEPENEHAMLDC